MRGQSRARRRRAILSKAAGHEALDHVAHCRHLRPLRTVRGLAQLGHLASKARAGPEVEALEQSCTSVPRVGRHPALAGFAAGGGSTGQRKRCARLRSGTAAPVASARCRRGGSRQPGAQAGPRGSLGLGVAVRGLDLRTVGQRSASGSRSSTLPGRSSIRRTHHRRSRADPAHRLLHVLGGGSPSRSVARLSPSAAERG